jgi:hypothetical protein
LTSVLFVFVEFVLVKFASCLALIYAKRRCGNAAAHPCKINEIIRIMRKLHSIPFCTICFYKLLCIFLFLKYVLFAFVSFDFCGVCIPRKCAICRRRLLLCVLCEYHQKLPSLPFSSLKPHWMQAEEA